MSILHRVRALPRLRQQALHRPQALEHGKQPREHADVGRQQMPDLEIIEGAEVPRERVHDTVERFERHRFALVAAAPQRQYFRATDAAMRLFDLRQELLYERGLAGAGLTRDMHDDGAPLLHDIEGL